MKRNPVLTNTKIVLAGGSGFLGGILCRHFARKKVDIVVLTRSPRSRADGVREILWDGRSTGPWSAEIEGASVVINLAGRSVNCRYTERNRQEIFDSRVNATRAIGDAIASCSRPPAEWLNASTATIYRHSIDRPMNDPDGEIGATDEAKDAFSVEVARAWEDALEASSTPKTRKVALRMAMVLGIGRNSVFPTLRRLARFGLGGTMASGRQYVSWIHEHDFCAAIDWVIAHDELSGGVNLAAPNPIPNREVMRIIRESVKAPIGLPATRWMLEVGAVLLRTETELIIKSRRAVPARLLASGFRFQFSTMQDAVAELCRRTNT